MLIIHHNATKVGMNRNITINIHRLAQVSNNNEEISAEMLRVELGWISESSKHTHGLVLWK